MKILTNKWLMTIVGVVLLCFIGVAICDTLVGNNAKDRLYDNVDSIPHRKVGLILGTSPISTWSGTRNHYFDYRIKAGVELYKAGKVDWIIVSGGDYRNSENGYDEPIAMRDSLIKQGVDSARIVLDYDGTRTLNSIAKIRDVYCQDSIVIISQKYHNERALYQAKHLGIDAIGFNATTPGLRTSWLRNRGREVLARVKLSFDILFSEKFYSVNKQIRWYSKLINLKDSNISLPCTSNGALLYTCEIDQWPYNVKSIYRIDKEWWYYNIVHQYGLLIPEGMQFNQTGEPGYDNTGNSFYMGENNELAPLIISCYADKIDSSDIVQREPEYDSNGVKYYSYTKVIPFISAKYGYSSLHFSIIWTDETNEIALNYIKRIKHNLVFDSTSL